MSGCWKRRGLVALLLLFSGSIAGAAEPPPTADLEKQIRELKSLVEQLKTTLDQTKADVSALRAMADDFNRNLKSPVTNSTLDVAAIKTKLEALEAKLQPALAQVDRIHTRVSGAQPVLTPRTTGTIRLENRSRYRATVVLDNVANNLEPGESRDLRNRPAGPFDYYVLADGFGQIKAPVTKILAPGTMHTIEINP